MHFSIYCILHQVQYTSAASPIPLAAEHKQPAVSQPPHTSRSGIQAASPLESASTLPGMHHRAMQAPNNCAPRFVTLSLVNPHGLPDDSLLLHSARRFGYTLELMVVNTSDPIETSSPYMAKIPKASRIIRAEACSRSVFMLVDGFDTFFTAFANYTLSRFQQMGKGVVWAAEAHLPYAQGIDARLLDAKARIPETEHSGYHREQAVCTNQSQAAPFICQQHSYLHRYLNAGGIIGYRDDLLKMFDELLSVRSDGHGWRNRKAAGCKEANGRQCAEQWAALRVLSFVAWDWLNVTLDYKGEVHGVALMSELKS